MKKTNIEFYEELLNKDDKWSMDSLFIFLKLKLDRLYNHYNSPDFQKYEGSDKDKRLIHRALFLSQMICEEQSLGYTPAQEDVDELFDILKQCLQWWD